MSGSSSAGARPRQGVTRALVVRLLSIAALAAASISAAAPAVGTYPPPLTVSVEEDGVLQLDGERRFLDTLHVFPDDEGLLLVNELGLERYVAGVAEMPARWPMEALKAQAVAARTYAWYVAEQDSYEHYDICATTACQVFRGADVVLDEAAGGRWQRAVEATSGQVLVDDDGDPILARYFSTSGGRTFANEEMFPASGPWEQLEAVDDPYDQVSPYHRWITEFTRAEFDAILSRGDTLQAAVPMVSAERLGSVRDPHTSIEVSGEDGTSVSVGARELSRFLSRVAPQLFPDRFPGLRSDGLRRLPSTVPSSRFEIEVLDERVVLRGQGWGHGVGMGQYGARGRAEAGHSYREILAAYYGGTQPTRAQGVPDRIRVGIGTASEVTVSADSAFSIRSSDGPVEDRTLGTWTLEPGRAAIGLTAPMHHDEPLELAPVRRAAGALDDSGVLTVETELNKAALLRLEVTDADGAPVVRRDLGAVGPGTQAVTWSHGANEAGAARRGEYRLTLIAEDAAGSTTRQSMDVVVGRQPPAGDAATSRGFLGRGLPAAGVAVVTAAVSLAVWMMIRSRRA